MIRVLLLFGGISSEHTVSLRSAAAVLAAFDRTEFDVLPVYITRTGGWYYLPRADAATLGALENIPENGAFTTNRPPQNDFSAESTGASPAYPCLLSPSRDARGLFYKTDDALRRLIPDVIFPVTHGGAGENGALFGLLTLSGIPYVGSSVGGAALGWDKAAAKTLAAAAGVPTLPFLVADEEDARDMPALVLRVSRAVGFPAFLKPVGEGSSVGASPALRPEELAAAFRTAAAHGGRVLIEPYFPARELEVALITQNGIPEAAHAAEITPPDGRFYDYGAKYLENSATLHTRAEISPALDTRVRAYAEKVFRALGLSAPARVDFFLARDGDALYFNEVNILPGMTEASMFPRALTAHRSLPALLSLLVREAMR